MYNKVLPGGTATALQILSTCKPLRDAYLAGGTAIALQLGHRISRDLDFFTSTSFDKHGLLANLQELGLEEDEVHEQTVIGTFQGIHFSYFFLRYPLLFDPLSFAGMRIADLRDCAVMKFEAIGGRVTRRGFIDLHAIMHARALTIPDLLSLHERKYRSSHGIRLHALRGLTYSADADDEQDRPLELLTSIDWEEVKRFFSTEVERTSRELFTPPSP